ncbi:hypothetical protein MITS9508_00568 [Synechococcus sp. MIT S9508]|nr:hypothetical protein MITS9508_00568 [Synechococcus sp. MIT S9508]
MQRQFSLRLGSMQCFDIPRLSVLFDQIAPQQMILIFQFWLGQLVD